MDRFNFGGDSAPEEKDNGKLSAMQKSFMKSSIALRQKRGVNPVSKPSTAASAAGHHSLAQNVEVLDADSYTTILESTEAPPT